MLKRIFIVFIKKHLCFLNELDFPFHTFPRVAAAFLSYNTLYRAVQQLKCCSLWLNKLCLREDAIVPSPVKNFDQSVFLDKIIGKIMQN